jgi:hypothetical protein
VAVTFQVEKIASLLNELLGRKVTVKTVPTLSSASVGPIVTASYEASEGGVVAVCVCDLGLVLNTGAALCMIPASEAADNLKTKQLDPALLENFKEVLNICAQLFWSPSAHRVKLAAVYTSAQERPEPLQKFIAKPSLRLDLQVSIAGYGDGRLSLFI